MATAAIKTWIISLAVARGLKSYVVALITYVVRAFIILLLFLLFLYGYHTVSHSDNNVKANYKSNKLLSQSEF